MGDLLRERYEVLQVVGRGGQGDVASGWDHQLGRPVALKVRPLWSGEDRDQLLAEARILLDLRPHPGLPLVRDDFFHSDRYVLVMDWVEGFDLGRLLSEQGNPGLPISAVLGYLHELASALDHLHSHDPPVVHGDVKPANAILAAGGRVVLVDFGLATTGRRLASMPGTMGYIAPEVGAGGRPTPAADVYSLAACAVTLLTGSPPGTDTFLRGAAIPGPLERALLRALAVDPADRPASAGELVEQLRTSITADLPVGVVTFCLTDIEGSTGLWETQPEAMALALSRHETLIAETVEVNGGRLIKGRGEGDSTLSAFTRASDAARAALELQRKIRREPWAGGIELRVRVALHTGEAQLRDGDYFGPTLNRAARIRGLARGGQVLLSQATADVLADSLPTGVGVVEIGAQRLKGLSRAEVVHALDHPELVPVTPESLPAQTEPGDAAEMESPGSPAPLAPSLLTLASTAFVGRRDELNKLRAAWQRARSGARQVTLLAGEPGIGKTRLAAELAREAFDEGAAVLIGRCDEQMSVPYQPFLEVLRACLDRLPDGILRSSLGPTGGELVRILPELARRVPDLPPPTVAEPDTERYRLFEAVCGVLDGAMRPGALFLVLDDLHWADESTLLLLRHIVRQRINANLMIVGTYRDTEVTRSSPLSAVLAEFNRETGCDRISLDGLGEGEIIDMLEGVGGEKLDVKGRAFARLLRLRTAGNPLFVYETVRSLADRGVIRHEEGRWASSLEPEDVGVPQGVREAIGQRLERLSPVANRVLRVATVVGATFPLDTIAAVAGLSDDELLDGLDEAVAAGLIAPVGRDEERYHFSHGLVQDVLYEEISPARRVRLHRQVAEAIEQLRHDQIGEHLGELAHHFLRAAPAGDRDRAIHYCVAAGDAASSQLAYHEAAEHYRRGVDALVALPGGEERRADLLLKLGEARWRAGEFSEARAAFREAAGVADGINRADILARAALGFGGEIGYQLGVRDDVLFELLEQAIAAAPAGDTAIRALLTARMAEASTLSDPGPRHEVLAREAIALARESQDLQVLANVLTRTYFAIWTPDNVDERIQMDEEMVRLGREVGDDRVALWGHLGRFEGMLELGRMDEADRDLEAADRLVANMRDPYSLWLVAVHHGCRSLLGGRLDTLEKVVSEALDIGRRTQHATAIQLWGVQLFWVLTELGRVFEIRAGTEACVEYFPNPQRFTLPLAFLYAEIGLEEEAWRWFEPIAGDKLRTLPRDLTWMGNVGMAAEVALALGDMVSADVVYELLLPYEGRVMVVAGLGAPRGSVDHYLGIIAAARARFDSAERHLTRALAIEQALDAPVLIAHTQHQLARLLLQRGQPDDRDGALALLDQAASAARDLGLTRVAARVTATLSSANGDDDGSPEPEGQSTGRSPGRFRARAQRAGDDIRAAVSTRGRSAIARLTRDATNEELERRFGSPLAQKTLFAGLARSFQPRMAFGFEGEIVIDLISKTPEGERSSSWTLEVHGRRATARRGAAEAPAMSVTLTLPEFVRIFSGERNLIGAVIEGAAVSEGDVLLGSRLVEMFGGVLPLDDMALPGLREGR